MFCPDYKLMASSVCEALNKYMAWFPNLRDVLRVLRTTAVHRE